MKIVGIIPARGGSKGLPGKNILEIAGKPTIAYVIEAAQKAAALEAIAVSTEAPQIAAVARRLGARIIARPVEYASDTAPIDPALRHAVRELEEGDTEIEIVVWLQANVPTTTPDLIDLCVDKLLETPEASSVQTVVEYAAPPQWALTIRGERLVPLSGVHFYTTRRQDTPVAYHPDGSVTVLRRHILMAAEGHPGPAYLGDERRAVVLDRNRSVEIDDPADLEFCEYVLSRRRLGACPRV